MNGLSHEILRASFPNEVSENNLISFIACAENFAKKHKISYVS